MFRKHLITPIFYISCLCAILLLSTWDHLFYVAVGFDVCLNHNNQGYGVEKYNSVSMWLKTTEVISTLAKSL